MKKTFSEASYLSQVRRLRSLAKVALLKYPLHVKSLRFINHGENATFQVIAKEGEFLLRVLRGGYHTDDAVMEELNWLNHLSKNKSLSIPKPVKSKNKRYLESAFTKEIPEGRNCCLFQWIEGRFIDDSLKPFHVQKVGALIARLQMDTPKKPVKHRRYWDAEGLVGKKPKFGAIDGISGVTKKQQDVLNKARVIIFNKLKAYEKRHPNRLSLIHADMHFGNLIYVGDNFAVIDFDDCGYGFHVYDLVTTLSSVEHCLGEKRMKEFPKYKEALLAGYRSLARFDQFDEDVMPHMMNARLLGMTGWLNSRSDNPRLKKILKRRIPQVVKSLKKAYAL